MVCYAGQRAVASELVNCGASVNRSNVRGCTPLHLSAASADGAVCLELLVNNGADVNIPVSRRLEMSRGLLQCFSLTFLVFFISE